MFNIFAELFIHIS